jgi:starch phosphorylase
MNQTIQSPPLSPRALAEAILRESTYSLGKNWVDLTTTERLLAVSLAVRERATETAIPTELRYLRTGAKRAYYLSLEFLIGRSLGNNLINLDMVDVCREAVRDLGVDLDELMADEPDAALGNGGLGRLAACFLDSMATVGLPGFGYGLYYQYGMFRQEIRDGQQVERPDTWLTHGTPWGIEKSCEAIRVPIFGRVDWERLDSGEMRPVWVETATVLGVPIDVPVVGYGARTVNRLRLFSARAPEDFDMRAFDEGRYLQAVEEKSRIETITKVLYPNEGVPQGPRLRLIQEYFLVACAIRDIVRHLELDAGGSPSLPKLAAIQLNDTHPSLAVAELMRLLVDEYRLPWETAWRATTGTLGYTNHTLMPEALERWPVRLMQEILPRHLQIIYEINRRHLEEVVAAHPNDPERIRRMSLIEEGPEQKVRMAYLAIVGSHSVNGVAEVHSELVKTHLVPDFYDLTPEKFNNKTNGVTPRRWVKSSNPGLAQLLTEAVGDGWVTDLEKLHGIERLADDAGFRERFRAVKRENKTRLAEVVRKATGVVLAPDALLDCQVKRIHEYKRQLLNLLHVVHDFLRITEDGYRPQPCVVLFGGKSAPGYYAAKEIIYLINKIAELVNSHPRCAGLMKAVFVPDYRVSLAEIIIPAADLSEQISTAGTEASGTSNMKFAMNGALTVGTLDGANIEIREEAGGDNVLIFGNTVEQIQDLQRRRVAPRTFYDRSDTVRRILDAFRGDRLSPGEPGKYSWVFHKLVDSWDPYFHLADLDSYLQTHDEADRLYRDEAAWARKAILNVARMGKFSSDRTVLEYARDIWDVAPAPPEAAPRKAHARGSVARP